MKEKKTPIELYLVNYRRVFFFYLDGDGKEETVCTLKITSI